MVSLFWILLLCHIPHSLNAVSKLKDSKINLSIKQLNQCLRVGEFWHIKNKANVTMKSNWARMTWLHEWLYKYRWKSPDRNTKGQSALNRSKSKLLRLWKSLNLKIFKESRNRNIHFCPKIRTNKKLKVIIIEISVQWPLEAMRNLHLIRIQNLRCWKIIHSLFNRRQGPEKTLAQQNVSCLSCYLNRIKLICTYFSHNTCFTDKVKNWNWFTAQFKRTWWTMYGV